MAKTETRRINIWINGKEVQNNIKDITAAYKKLINEQAQMTVGSKEYMAHAAKIKQLKGSIDEHKRQIGSIATAWQKAKDTIVATGFGVLGGNMITALTTRIGGFFSNIVTGAAKMSDQMADIRKTTGMTMEEVEGLSSSLSKIDTRTSASDLRQMAIVAGQLGIAKDDVLGFVDAVDKTAVALGDEFTGGADEVAATVGKLRNVFSDMQSDNVGQDIMHISNALNELGAAGFATGPVVADFANRIGGVGITLGLTSGQVLGLSATLQELNVSTERGGTAVVKILQKMTTETGKFATIAGMNVTDFEKLVNTDLYGAFTKVMEGSKRSGSSATALAGIIKELEIQGAGASEVFAKLGGNVGMLNEKVDLASNSLMNTDSILAEFTLKNENLAGQWEKAKKTVQGFVMAIGKQLAPALVSMGAAFVNFIEWIKRNANGIIDFVKILGVGAVALVSYRLATKLAAKEVKDLRIITLMNTAVTKAATAVNIIAKGVYYLWAAAVALLSGNMKKATQAMRIFSAVTKASPIGMLAGVVFAATAAFAAFGNSASRSASAAKKAMESIAGENSQLEIMKQKLISAYGNKEKFNAAVKEWNENYGVKYNASLNATTANLNDIISATNKAREAMLKMAYVNILKEDMEKYMRKNAQMYRMVLAGQNELSKEQEKYRQAESDYVYAIKEYNKAIKEGRTDDANTWKKHSDAMLGYMVTFDNNIQKIKAQLKGLDDAFGVQSTLDGFTKQIAELETQMGGLGTDVPMVTDTGGDAVIPDAPLSETGAKKQKELKKKYLDIYEQLQEKIRDLREKFQLEEMSAEDKEIQEVENKYDELIVANTEARAEISALGSKADKEDLEAYRKLMDQLVELEKLKEEEQAAVRAKYAKLKAEERDKVEEQIRVALLSDSEKEREDVIKKYQDLIDLAKKYGFDTVELYKKMQEELEKLKKKEKTDIFGMTSEDWEKLKKDFDEVGKLMRALGDVADSINTIITNGEEKHMQQVESNYNKEMEKLETMYAQKHMSEYTYTQRKKQLENQLAAQKLSIEIAQAKRKKNIATFDAILDTASAIAEALPNIPLSILMGVLGGIQIAAIRSEPLPQLWTGGYTMKDTSNTRPAGTVHANEWVSPAWMVNNPVTGPMISQLEAIRASGNSRRSVSVPQQQRNMAQTGSSDITAMKLDMLIHQNEKLLKYMSDPKNRRAFMVHDEFKRYEADLTNLQQLRKIS